MCGKCHSLDGQVGAGPPLNGVIDRQIAAVPKFGYSPALASSNGRWTESLLASFVGNPGVVMPGTSMGPTGIYQDQAEDLVAYLKTTHEAVRE
jgi:cytochrome c